MYQCTKRISCEVRRVIFLTSPKLRPRGFGVNHLQSETENKKMYSNKVQWNSAVGLMVTGVAVAASRLFFSSHLASLLFCSLSLNVSDAVGQ